MYVVWVRSKNPAEVNLNVRICNYVFAHSLNLACICSSALKSFKETALLLGARHAERDYPNFKY